VGCSDDTGSTKLDSGPGKKDGKVVKNDGKAKADKKVYPDTGPVKSAQVCGTLEDPSGNKLPNHPVIVCDDLTCYSDDSTGTGTFCVAVDAKGEYITHSTATTKAGKPYTDVYFPTMVTQADINGEKKIQVGKVVVPFTPKALQKVDIKAGGAHDLGGGVSVTIAAGSAKKPPLEPDLKIGAAVLKKGQVNPATGKYYKGSGKLHMAVAFRPLETTFTTPMSFKFPGHGLAAGAAVEIYFISEKDGKLTKQGDGKESGGSIVNVTGQGIKHLGMILVYTK